MRFTALLILIFLAAFTGTALAADAIAATDPSYSELAKAIFDAVMHSQWWAAAATGVVLACALARKYMPAGWKTGTKGDIIGIATTFLMAFAGSLGMVLAAPGAAMTGGVALTALKIGAAAIGGYTIIHKVVGWLTAWGKLPPWLMMVLAVLGKLVGSDAAQKAQAAGDAAIAADPPKGMAGDDKIVEVE